MMLAAMAGCAVVASPALEPYRVDGDAIPAHLGSATGDPARGREVMTGRDANCLLCHAVPETGIRFMGDIAPPLSGIGSRLSAGQLRLRIVDQSRLNAETVMPSYYRIEGLVRVAPAYRGKPVLTAQQIEDVVAYLQTLK
jgi:sulfur-oxidizing protein SoxX